MKRFAAALTTLLVVAGCSEQYEFVALGDGGVAHTFRLDKKTGEVCAFWSVAGQNVKATGCAGRVMEARPHFTLDEFNKAPVGAEAQSPSLRESE